MMKKIVALICIVTPLLVQAQTCPPAATVFEQRGDKYVPAPPVGWQFSDWSSHIRSSDIRFVLAAYGADLHPPTDKDNHVRCYYGNPDLSPKHGIGIETIAVIPESAVSTHPEWHKNEHYYMCGQTINVTDCQFG